MNATETGLKLIKQFNQEYENLYNSQDKKTGYREAVNWFDANCSKEPVKTILSDFIKLRMDFISSDREAAAFTYAIHELNLI